MCQNVAAEISGTVSNAALSIAALAKELEELETKFKMGGSVEKQIQQALSLFFALQE